MKKEIKNSKPQEEAFASTVTASQVADTADINSVADRASVSTPLINEPQAEKEGKVGLLLQEVRKKQGKTIAEISQELCIRKLYLTAIEESNYDEIPEYPYGNGFIRSYADYLGLDGANIVQMYKEESDANLSKNNPYFVAEPQVEATVPGKKYLIISLISVFAIYFAWSIYSLNSSSDVEETLDTVPTQENVADTEEQAEYPLKVEDFSVNEANEENNLPVVEVKPVEKDNNQIVVKETNFVDPILNRDAKQAQAEAAVKVETPTAPVKVVPEAKIAQGLVIKVKKDTWIEVKNDDKLYISKVLMPGDSYVMPKSDKLKLSVGKADGVDVTYNGKVIYTIAPNKKMNISVDDILSNVKNQ